jgi:hypothetical protein
MNTLRVSAVAVVVSTLLAGAWSVSAGGCGPGSGDLCGNQCNIPDLQEYGEAGEFDPCWCDVPYPLHDCSCPCTSNALFPGSQLTGRQVYMQCLALVPSDAGDSAEGGP